jgi:anti-sigma-K factor RskA
MDLSMIMEHIDAIGLVPLLLAQSYHMNQKMDAQAAAMEAQRKEHDDKTIDMVRGWEKQLVALVNKYEEREDEIRTRYDRVVENYNNERDKMFRDMERKLDDAIRFFQMK